MDEQGRKLLTEQLLEERFCIGLVGLPYTHQGVKSSNRTFTTPDDMMAVKDKLKGNDEFLSWFGWSAITYDEGMIYVKRLLEDWDTPTRFCDLARQFLRERGRE